MSRNAHILFLLVGLVLGLAPRLLAAVPAPGNASPPPGVLKVVGHHLLQAYQPNDDQVEAVFNRGLTDFTHTPNPAAAWQTLVHTNDTVGIKVFSPPGPWCGTRKSVVRAVIRGLLASGLPGHQIIIWDKEYLPLETAGFPDLARELGVSVMSARQAGYDPDTFYLPDSPVVGQLVWGDLEFGRTNREAGRRSFFSKLVSRRITKLISVTPLMNEDTAGVCGHFYSLALGSVDNTRRFDDDSSRLAVALPEIVAQPPLTDHTVLYVTDALLGQCQGGPSGYLQFSTELDQIWFSHDPVALDTVALQELNQERARMQIPGWSPNLEIYTNAALLQLGQNQPDQIPVRVIP